MLRSWCRQVALCNGGYQIENSRSVLPDRDLTVSDAKWRYHGHCYQIENSRPVLPNGDLKVSAAISRSHGLCHQIEILRLVGTTRSRSHGLRYQIETSWSVLPDRDLTVSDHFCQIEISWLVNAVRSRSHGQCYQINSSLSVSAARAKYLPISATSTDARRCIDASQFIHLHSEIPRAEIIYIIINISCLF